MNASNDGHLTVADCERNRAACQETGRQALKHAERHRKAGHAEAVRDWTRIADQCAADARYWREKVVDLIDPYAVPGDLYSTPGKQSLGKPVELTPEEQVFLREINSGRV